MDNVKIKVFEKWYSFYRLMNNKIRFTESETTLAILRIKFAIEEFLSDRRELKELLELRGIIDNGISDQKITYVSNSRMFIRGNIILEKGDMNNQEFNEYIYEKVCEIVYDNIDVYLDACDEVLTEDENLNIKNSKELFENNILVEKIVKLLYLFRNSEKEETKIFDIEKFLELSVINREYISKDELEKLLNQLEEKEVLHIDWLGNCSIVNENKKRLKEMISTCYKKIDNDEKNAFIFKMISKLIREAANNIGLDDFNISVDIDGNKLIHNDSNLILKLDNYIKENRDIRRGYYVLNTKQYKNILFWYGKRILDLDERAKYVLAYAKAVEKLEVTWRSDENKAEFLLEQNKVLSKNINDFKQILIGGFINGSYIFRGEDKKIGIEGSIKEVIKMLIGKLNN